ncbi:MAG: matrixin family metalloprotease [Fimbriimonadaceae bacterium]|nr:matrixin family metalloprotease [Fimbriimonadaceae bacterium]
MKNSTLGRSLLVLAGLVVVGQAGAYSLLSQKWDVGVNKAEVMAGNLGTAGSATWSVMGAGLGMEGYETHGGALTTSLTALTSGDEIAMIGAAIDAWAAVCNFTNLGMVADGGVNGGASEASGGHLGDMRFASIFIDGGAGPNVLAHAYTPGTETLNGAGGTILGDVHFDNGNTWGDGSGGTIDFYTVALHEIGHALGLGHSSVTGSIMEPVYAGPRHTLHADDIAGIQAIYGARAPVPEPATMVLATAALLTAARRRKRTG